MNHKLRVRVRVDLDPDASPLSLRAHPNPSRGAVTLVASGLPVGPARIDVYDIVGRRVARLDATATAGVARFSFPPGMRLRAGAYAARMVDGSASVMFTVW